MTVLTYYPHTRCVDEICWYTHDHTISLVTFYDINDVIIMTFPLNTNNFTLSIPPHPLTSTNNTYLPANTTSLPHSSPHHCASHYYLLGGWRPIVSRPLVLTIHIYPLPLPLTILHTIVPLTVPLSLGGWRSIVSRPLVLTIPIYPLTLPHSILHTTVLYLSLLSVRRVGASHFPAMWVVL